MYCPACGRSLRPEDLFCPQCGTRRPEDAAAPTPAETVPVMGGRPEALPAQFPFPTAADAVPAPAAPKRKGGKGLQSFWPGLVVGLVIVALLFGLLSLTGFLLPGRTRSFTEARIEGRGFNSGEEALLALAKAMKKMDTDKMISCYAVESFAENFRYDDYYAYYDMNPNYLTTAYYPEDSRFGADHNRLVRLGTVCTEAGLPFVAAANGYFENEMCPRNESTTHEYYRVYADRMKNADFTFSDYSKALGGKDVKKTFSKMELVGKPFDITKARSKMFTEDERRERYRQRNRQQAEAIGADEIRDYGVAVRIGGCDGYLTVQTVCYDGRWYILRLGSYEADISSLCGGFTKSVPGGDD